MLSKTHNNNATMFFYDLKFHILLPRKNVIRYLNLEAKSLPNQDSPARRQKCWMESEALIVFNAVGTIGIGKDC